MIVLLSREVGHDAVPSSMEAELNPDAPVPRFNHWNMWRKEEVKDRCSREVSLLRQILLFMGAPPYIQTHTYISFSLLPCSSKSLKLPGRLGEPILQPPHRSVVRISSWGSWNMCGFESHCQKRNAKASLPHPVERSNPWPSRWNSSCGRAQHVLFCAKFSPVFWEHLSTWLVPVRWMGKKKQLVKFHGLKGDHCQNLNGKSRGNVFSLPNALEMLSSSQMPWKCHAALVR